jgi:hypothetical protein
MAISPEQSDICVIKENLGTGLADSIVKAKAEMATIPDDDERLLAELGYEQVKPDHPILPEFANSEKGLKRSFTRWSTVSYAVSVLGVLGSVPATFGNPLALGGPAAAVWAWPTGSLMAQFIASSGTYSRRDCEVRAHCYSCRTGIGLSHSRRNVFCDQKCRSEEAFGDLVLGNWLV